MAFELDGQSEAVGQAPGGGATQRVGWFRLHFEDQRWEWSEEVQRLHGYEPGTMTPTTDLVLSHKHPEDRPRVAALIDTMLGNRRGAFSTRHRIVDTAGVVHQVVVVGDQFCDDEGKVVGNYGFYVDVTPESRTDREDSITAKAAAIAERRGTIEQAKGMLMVVYGLDEDAAFNVLKSLSQVHNIKLGLLAQQIAEDFSTLGEAHVAARPEFDQLLLTAHLRASNSADRPDSTAS